MPQPKKASKSKKEREKNYYAARCVREGDPERERERKKLARSETYYGAKGENQFFNRESKTHNKKPASEAKKKAAKPFFFLLANGTTEERKKAEINIRQRASTGAKSELPSSFCCHTQRCMSKSSSCKLSRDHEAGLKLTCV
jgi:hypothetical protein